VVARNARRFFVLIIVPAMQELSREGAGVRAERRCQVRAVRPGPRRVLLGGPIPGLARAARDEDYCGDGGASADDAPQTQGAGGGGTAEGRAFASEDDGGTIAKTGSRGREEEVPPPGRWTVKTCGVAPPVTRQEGETQTGG
jgi:hypothetical protein